MEPKDVELSPSEFDEYLKMFYPDSKKIKKKAMYLCKACQLKFTAEGFYTHIRTVREFLLVNQC